MLLRRNCHAWTPSASGRCRLLPTRRFLSVSSDNDKAPSQQPFLWKGRSSSAFVTHILAGNGSPTVLDAIASVLTDNNTLDSTTTPINNHNNDNDDDKDVLPLDNSKFTPMHLLKLGSVWFLPQSTPRDPTRSDKVSKNKPDLVGFCVVLSIGLSLSLNTALCVYLSLSLSLSLCCFSEPIPATPTIGGSSPSGAARGRLSAHLSQPTTVPHRVPIPMDTRET